MLYQFQIRSSHFDVVMLMLCCRYEEAFLDVLDREDVSMVAWLCSQVDPGSLLSQKPPVLSQQILLPMLQQLGYDLLKVNTPLSSMQSSS